MHQAFACFATPLRRPIIPYPMDPTMEAPQGYRLTSPRFEEPPVTHVRQTNVAPALGPTPLNQPNSPNPNPFAGLAALQQPHTDKELRINLPQPFNGDRKKWDFSKCYCTIPRTQPTHLQ